MPMKYINTCVLIFIDEMGRVLMHERKNKSKIGESWAFLGGGIEDGEITEDALKREIREEVGYNLGDYFHFHEYKGAYNANLSGQAHVYIAKFPGFSVFKMTEEGDIRNDLKLIEPQKALKMDTLTLNYLMLKDVISEQEQILRKLYGNTNRAPDNSSRPNSNNCGKPNEQGSNKDW